MTITAHFEGGPFAGSRPIPAVKDTYLFIEKDVLRVPVALHEYQLVCEGGVIRDPESFDPNAYDASMYDTAWYIHEQTWPVFPQVLGIQ